MLELNATVTIGGSDYSVYVVSISRRHNICEQIASAEIELVPSAARPTVYDQVIIHEQGVKVFTGYVTNTNMGRTPASSTVSVSDPAIKLQDYWLDQEYASSGETAEYWIGFFCDLVGVSYIFDVSYNRVIPPVQSGDRGWIYTSAIDVIRELLIVGGFYMHSDADGVLHFSNIQTGTAPEDISSGVNLISLVRERSITPTRNRAIVFGRYPITASATVTVPELSGTQKTAVVATRFVADLAYAEVLAGSMLDYFAVVADTKRAEVLPNPNYAVGQSVNISEPWIGLSSVGIITTVESQLAANRHTMVLVIDQFCPYIWGYAILTVSGIVLYAGTDGIGVWKTGDLGLTWIDITGNLGGDDLYVRGISASGDLVWAATLGGVYKTTVGGNTWTDFTPTLPPGVSVTDWTDVEIDPTISGVVYVLMDDVTNGVVYMHKTSDEGATWTNVKVTE